jgi:hypothetical protein
LAEVITDLEQHNPEFLDMALKWARSLDNSERATQGFAMFYRLILAPSVPGQDGSLLHPLPRVTPMTRALLVEQIDDLGSDTFITTVVSLMETQNPELLQMAHNFAFEQPDYLPLMQGFTLLYKALFDQAVVDRTHLH